MVAKTATIVFSLVLLVLESQPKPSADYLLLDEDEDDNPEVRRSPEDRANIFSRLTYSWISSLIAKGYETPLQANDVYKLGHKYRPDVAAEEFQYNWKKECNSGRPSLVKALVKTYFVKWTAIAWIKLLAELLGFLDPIILWHLIGFVSAYGTPLGEPIENGYFYAISMTLVTTLETVVQSQHSMLAERLECLMKSSIKTAIYRKTLVLSNDSRQKHNIGSIISHMTSDGTRVMNA
ncbi:hypothetical protein IWW54_006635, partial [Coemansia sp. RSA 2705]